MGMKAADQIETRVSTFPFPYFQFIYICVTDCPLNTLAKIPLLEQSFAEKQGTSSSHSPPPLHEEYYK